ncbi:MAG TPA: hypothetical protein VLG37_04835 [Candidatus Saccharimonadales bacterium]|nr:hypothetical protein [Candidatus Saccharimonadales bacterium]
MLFIRKSLYHFLAGLLFLFLVGTAWTTALSLTFAKPAKLESWLSESKLYDHFMDNVIAQSQKSGESQGGQNGGSLNLKDPGVQQAAKAAFSPQVLQGSVNNFLDANYAWLEGKTPTPDFRVDLSGAKANLASNVGAYVQSRLSGLPKCTTTVSADNFDPLSATCLPRGVTPTSAAQQSAAQIAGGQDFLKNPVITPQTLSQTDKNQSSQPYYQKLSWLPRAYRLATGLPYILGLLSALAALGVIFIALTRRRGTRKVATALLSSGGTILLLVLVSRVALGIVDKRVFINSNVAQLQAPLVNFADRAQWSVAKLDLWFGGVFIVLAVALYLALHYSKPKLPKTDLPGEESVAPTTPKPKKQIAVQ